MAFLDHLINEVYITKELKYAEESCEEYWIKTYIK